MRLWGLGDQLCWGQVGMRSAWGRAPVPTLTCQSPLGEALADIDLAVAQQ